MKTTLRLRSFGAGPAAALPARRGSVLIVALLLAAIIGVALVSYLKLTTSSLQQAQRTFLGTGAMNLAEVGLEEAIYAFNSVDNTSLATAWAGWTLNDAVSPKTAARNFTGFTPGQNSTGLVKVYVEAYDGVGTAPVVVSKSIVTPDTGPVITRVIKVTLRKRGLFSNGLVARNNITWSGHPLADSWNSDPDNDPSTAAVDYSTSVRTANVVVGSLTGDIGLSGGEIYGYAKTGSTGTITGGTVHGLGTTADDPTRRTNDFNATFPPVTTPSPTTVNTIASTLGTGDLPLTLPRTGDAANAADGKFYYRLPGISTNGNSTKILTIAANVVLLPTAGSGSTAVSIGGNASIAINSGATLLVYTQANLSIGGNGVANSNPQPISFQVYGTNSSVGGQSIDISGNGRLQALVYAPNATLSLNGGGTNGDVMGAAVGNTITMNGGTAFHYDDSLGNFTTGNPYGISNWRELTTDAERATYAAAFATF
ncbi:MAG: hypothetical protein HY302_16300 [Opitutae bacterium]|nr:hypothetical protein [Opitutae bacterium]